MSPEDAGTARDLTITTLALPINSMMDQFEKPVNKTRLDTALENI
jgi:hypothetical protein